MNCSWSFCTVRKVISYFFRFLIRILVKDTFYRLKMLSESSWHFRCLWSAGAKSKHSFYPSNSGITAIPPFSFFNQLLCNFPIKDTQVQKTAIAPASFFTHQPCIWDLLCQADSRSFSLGLFALQTPLQTSVVYTVMSSQLTSGPLHSIQEQEECAPVEHYLGSASLLFPFLYFSTCLSPSTSSTFYISGHDSVNRDTIYYTINLW